MHYREVQSYLHKLPISNKLFKSALLACLLQYLLVVIRTQNVNLVIDFSV